LANKKEEMDCQKNPRTNRQVKLPFIKFLGKVLKEKELTKSKN